jgi:putative hemolysin
MIKQTFFVIALMFASAISMAQSVPNGNFETWSNPNGYLVPNDWETLNGMTSSAGVYTATRGGILSDYYLKLTSQNVPGMGVMPGIAVSGMLDMGNLTALSGFPFSFRPVAFTGKRQSMSNSVNDTGYIRVLLTKWNTAMGVRDTVGYASQDLTGMQMTWANFALPFTYTRVDVPDSCIIIMSSSGKTPESGSYLYVDYLGFSGITTGIEKTETTGAFAIFPNPSNQEIQLDLSGLKSAVQQVEIIDITGRVIVKRQNNGLLLQTISIDELPAGNYFLKVTTAKGIVTQKISKQ